jgi:allophycocyanin beta subunit
MTNALPTIDDRSSVLRHQDFASFQKIQQTSSIRFATAQKITANDRTIVAESLKSLASEYSHLEYLISKYQLASYIPNFPDCRFILRYVSYAILAKDASVLDQCLNGLKEAYDDLKISPFFIVRVLKPIKNFAIALIDDDQLSQETSEYFDIVIASFGEEKPPLWVRLVEIGRQVPDEEWAKLPTDLSRNFEHYMYGAEKEE